MSSSFLASKGVSAPTPVTRALTGAAWVNYEEITRFTLFFVSSDTWLVCLTAECLPSSAHVRTRFPRLWGNEEQGTVRCRLWGAKKPPHRSPSSSDVSAVECLFALP